MCSISIYCDLVNKFRIWISTNKTSIFPYKHKQTYKVFSNEHKLCQVTTRKLLLSSAIFFFYHGRNFKVNWQCRKADLARLVWLLDPGSLLLPSKSNTIHSVKISYWGPKIWHAGQDYTCWIGNILKLTEKNEEGVHELYRITVRVRRNVNLLLARVTMVALKHQLQHN